MNVPQALFASVQTCGFKNTSIQGLCSCLHLLLCWIGSVCGDTTGSIVYRSTAEHGMRPVHLPEISLGGEPATFSCKCDKALLFCAL